MALSTELYGLKSAGTYRFERDQSVTMDTATPLENVRMLVGFSKVGPFNTPVFIQNTREFINTFGDIDRTLEKRGSYFHRSCLAALSAGPIYALNLLKLTDEDKVDAMRFSTSVASEAQDENPQAEGNLFDYRGMYNIENFYTPSEESFLYTIGRKNYYEEKSTNCILNFTNIGKSPVSVIVTRANEYNSTNFKVTAQEWYGKGNVPEYLHETSYMSDYMVDVYVLAGNWGGDFNDEEGHPYRRFASDIKFGKYFDKDKGFIRRKNADDTTDTMLTQFLNEPDVKLIGKYTGSLIPGLVDKNGRNIYIEYMINSDTATNGLMCSVNEQIFDGDVKLDGARYGIDMVGHSLYDAIQNDNYSNVRFLSYSGNVSGKLEDDILGGASLSLGTGTDAPYALTIDTSIPKDLELASNATPRNGAAVDEFRGGIAVINTKEGNGTIRKYVYYYMEKIGEDADHNPTYEYVEPSASATNTKDEQRDAAAYENIFAQVAKNDKVYMEYNNNFWPITNIAKTTLNGVTDNSAIPQEVANIINGNAAQQTDKFFNNIDTETRIAHPIVKYVITLKADANHQLSDTSDISNDGGSYLISEDFNGGFIFNGNPLPNFVFLEGSNVYANRKNLSTHDKIDKDGGIDIDWYDNIHPITTVNGTEIANAAYAPDYVAAYLTEGEEDAQQQITNFSFNDNKVTVLLGAGHYEMTITVKRSVYGIEAKENEFFIPAESNDESYDYVKIGNFILSKDGDNHRLTRIAEITGVSDPESGIVTWRKVACQDKVVLNNFFLDSTDNTEWCSTECFCDITEYFTHYNVFTLGGFTLKKSHMPDGTNERQHEILDLLAEDSKDSNLFNALIDRELIQFRYLVDTFGFGIEESCKDQYTKLCKERKSAFAIINAPSSNDFKISENPSFIDKNKSVSAEFIAKGGDPDKNPTFLFSLPDVAHGATWGAYYYPYLKVYSNYTTINVPPAAYVSNLYVAKYETGQPWNAVAGQNRGVISGNNVVGVESTLVRDNRDWLEPAGINSIIYQNGVGCVIYANKTAKQTPKSALSEINCREACIYIQDGVEKILRNYLFEVNNAQTRLEIKTLVDNFIDMVKNNGGVYDFKTVMDKSNNTNEVIDHNMGVIDIFIEPARAMDILVQKLTILRTGVIESGTFE